jgi:hypothetical protein
MSQGMSGDTSSERALALVQATALYTTRFTGGTKSDKTFLATASAVYEWLTGPVTLSVRLGPRVDQTTGQPTGNMGGNELKDTEKALVIIDAVDAKDNPTSVPTDVDVTVADAAVATVTQDDAGWWVVAGSPGSTVGTVEWPSAPGGPISGTVAIDVTTGDAVSLRVTLGTPVPQ